MVLHLTIHQLSARATAAAFCVSAKTVRRWRSRAQEAGFPKRLADHSSVPLRQPRKTTLRSYYENMKRIVAEFKKEHGRLPTDNELRKKAVEILKQDGSEQSAEGDAVNRAP